MSQASPFSPHRFSCLEVWGGQKPSGLRKCCLVTCLWQVSLLIDDAMWPDWMHIVNVLHVHVLTVYVYVLIEKFVPWMQLHKIHNSSKSQNVPRITLFSQYHCILGSWKSKWLTLTLPPIIASDHFNVGIDTICKCNLVLHCVKKTLCILYYSYWGMPTEL